MLCYTNLVLAMFMKQHMMNACPFWHWKIIKLVRPGRDPEFAVIQCKGNRS